MKRVLVISPHPDDESIGCGGAICKAVRGGDEVRVLFLTSGEAGGHGRSPAETARVREAEACDAAAILGVAAVDFLRGPDGGLRAAIGDGGAVARRMGSDLAERLGRWRPHELWVTHFGEMHSDHRAAAALVRREVTGLPAGLPRPDVWMYEVWTPLQRFDRVVDISDHLEAKRAAVRAHRSQCEVMAFDEACLGLNRYRGEMHSWPEGEYAEVLREWKLPARGRADVQPRADVQQGNA